jgi:hypothetical protein
MSCVRDTMGFFPYFSGFEGQAQLHGWLQLRATWAEKLAAAEL